MRTDLLPPNSTDLERKLAQVGAPAILDLGDDAAIRGRKFDPPDNWLDALIWEYALGEITPYISDKRRLISEGIRWTRLRGTPASLHIAFSWVGLDADIIESPPSIERNEPGITYRPHRHFAEYDLRPHGTPTPAQICQLVNLALLSQPVRSRLWRLVYGYDRGVFRLDDSLLDDALLDDDSGIRIDHAQLPCLPAGSQPKISFGTAHGSWAMYEGASLSVAITITIAHVISSVEAHILYFFNDTATTEIYTIQAGSSTPRAVALYFGQVWADAPWPSSTWTNTNVIINNCEDPD